MIQDDDGAAFAAVLAEATRSIMALGLVGGGLAILAFLAFTRSADEATRFAGVIGGVMGSVVTYYFTRGIAESAQRRALAEATERIRVETGADNMALDLEAGLREAKALVAATARERQEYLALLRRAAHDEILRRNSGGILKRWERRCNMAMPTIDLAKKIAELEQRELESRRVLRSLQSLEGKRLRDYLARH